MTRRSVVVLAVFLAVVVILGITLPWWCGVAAKRVAGHFGVEIGRYTRVGYVRFQLHDVRVLRGPVTVTLADVEADTPLLWAWRHLRAQPSMISVGNWSVDVRRQESSQPSRPGGWVPLRDTLHRVASLLDRWLPEARTGAGRVRWPGGELSLQAATWHPRTLRVRGLAYHQATTDLTAVFGHDNDTIDITAVTADGALVLKSSGNAVSGHVTWWAQDANIDAHFGRQGWIPADVKLQAEAINLPGNRTRMGGLYAAIVGHAYAAWRAGHFFVDVALNGESVKNKAAPPLAVVLRGRGDVQTFTVDALHLSLPGATAELSEPVTINRQGQFAHGDPRFSVRMDLARQPWVKGTGILSADAKLVSSLGQAPLIEFQAEGRGVSVGEVSIAQAEGAGHFAWPELQIERFVLRDTAGGLVEAHGGWNFRTKELVGGVVRGSIHRTAFGSLVPASLSFDRIAIDAQAAGTLGALKHSGTVQGDQVTFGSSHRCLFRATWQGQASSITAFTTRVTAGTDEIAVSGSAGPTGAILAEGAFRQHSSDRLRLVHPVHIRWRPSVEIDDLRLAGPDASIDASLSWSVQGKIKVVARAVRSDWASAFFPIPGLKWVIDSLALSGTWNHGAMSYTTAGSATVQLTAERTATVTAAAHGGVDGLTVDALHAIENGHDIIDAKGAIPLTVQPGTRPIVALKSDGKVSLDATTVPNAAFWAELSQLTGVELRDPEIVAHLHGTWLRPEGTLAARANRIEIDPKRFVRPLPSIDVLDVAISADPRQIMLERLTFNIEGQVVRASGRLPVSSSGWTELLHDPLTFLRRGASARIEVPDAQVAMFSRFLPAALAPMGRLEADVRYDRGALGGFLRLRGAASRPLGPLGVLQQIDADVEFSDQAVNFKKVVAVAGGAPVALSGEVQLPNRGWLGFGGGEPKYNLTVRGKNLPFVRQAGLLVRGDLDLKLETPANGPPRISGQVGLRDSLFLTDVRSFLPHGGTAAPERRPPYFSIATPPLSTWTLDVEVSGARFMRLRTPVFNGLVSARFHLGGTLREPRALGEATIDQGQVLMPFATFDVRQGTVRLTEENPFEPSIYLRGTGTHFGYDLTMEISGKASTPDITFRSSPALDPDQVLLMVMTGAAPANDINTSMAQRAIQIGAFFGHSLVGGLFGGGDSDRLSIESGEKISQQGNETYDIEYKLNRRWTLTGEYDEFDEYNVGFKWLVAPKRPPK